MSSIPAPAMPAHHTARSTVFLCDRALGTANYRQQAGVCCKALCDACSWAARQHIGSLRTGWLVVFLAGCVELRWVLLLLFCSGENTGLLQACCCCRRVKCVPSTLTSFFLSRHGRAGAPAAAFWPNSNNLSFRLCSGYRALWGVCCSGYMAQSVKNAYRGDAGGAALCAQCLQTPPEKRRNAACLSGVVGLGRHRTDLSLC